jgi:hypothetical protein
MRIEQLTPRRERADLVDDNIERLIDTEADGRDRSGGHPTLIT